MSFFLFKGKKKEKKKVEDVSARAAATQAALASGTASWLGVGSQSADEAVVGSGVFSSVGLGIPLWRLDSLGLFLPFTVLQSLCSWEKRAVFAFKIRTERKESLLMR